MFFVFKLITPPVCVSLCRHTSGDARQQRRGASKGFIILTYYNHVENFQNQETILV